MSSEWNFNIYWLIFFYLAVRATNQIFFKLVAISSHSYWMILSNILFYICCLLFMLQALIWIKVLHSMPLSKAYPFTALIFIFILLSGAVFFHEAIDLGHILGTGIIICGVLVITIQE